MVNYFNNKFKFILQRFIEAFQKGQKFHVKCVLLIKLSTNSCMAQYAY